MGRVDLSAVAHLEMAFQCIDNDALLRWVNSKKNMEFTKK